MGEWKQLHPAITEVLQKLPENAYLAMRNNANLMQFAVVDAAEGRVLRAEVCRDSPDDEPRLRTKGWELVDSWSGLWRRDIPAGSDGDTVSELVVEAIGALRMAGVRDPDGFTYLSWQEAPAKAGWQFWKAGKDKPLTWPDLGMRPGMDDGD